MGTIESGERGGAGNFTAYLFSRHGLLFAVGTLLLVLSVLFFTRRALDDYAAGAHAAEAAVAARIVLDTELRDASILAAQTGELLINKSLSAATEVSASAGAFRPDKQLFFYDEKGAPVLAGGNAASGALDVLHPGLFKLVEKALRGLPASGRIEVNGAIYCAAAVQSDNKAVKVVAAAAPAFPRNAASLRRQIHARIFLLLKDAAGTPHLFGASTDAAQDEEHTSAGVPQSPSQSASDASGDAFDLNVNSLYDAVQARGDTGFIPISLSGKTYLAGVEPLHDDKDGSTAYVLAVPEKTPPTFFSAPILLFFAVTWALLVLIAASLFYQRERMLSASMVRAIAGLSTHGLVEPDLERAAPMQQALDRAAAALRSERAAAERYAAERDAALRRLENKGLLWPAEKLDAVFRFFFENSMQGIFLIREDGLFLRINQSFANLIRYDSPTMLLNDRPSFAALFPYTGDSLSLLDNLKNQPYRPFIVPLRLRDGRIRNFTVTSIRTGMEEADGMRTIAGFIAARAVEERNELLQQQYEQTRKEHEGLALLLAVTCLQAQTSLNALGRALSEGTAEPPEDTPAQSAAPVADRAAASAAASAGAPVPVPAPILERPVEKLFGESPNGSGSLLRHIDADSFDPVKAQRLILEDVHRLAVAEAEHIPPIPAPMNLLRILDDVCTQITPMLRERDIMLFCEVEKDLPFVMDGPAVLLRHVLFRAVSSMVLPVRGGSAFLSVVRDPNAPQSEAAPRLLFSASWVDSTDAAVVPAQTPVQTPDQTPTRGSAPKAARTPAQAPAQTPTHTTEEQEIPSPELPHGEDPGPFSLREERDLLQFLLEKMNGELLAGKIGTGTRAVQFAARFDAFSAADGEGLRSGVSLPSHSMGAAVRSTEYTFQGTDYTGAQQPEMRLSHTAEAVGVVLPSESSTEDEQLMLDAATAVFPAGGQQERNADASLQMLVMDEAFPKSDQPSEAAIDDSLDILLIDDSANNRLLFSYFLRETHHRLMEASDGRHGIDILRNRRFDVIFMDMEMPLLNGYQATRIIRAMESDLGRAPAPVVALTAHMLPDVKYQCSLAGCTESLSKPLNKNALLTMLDAFARVKRDFT